MTGLLRLLAAILGAHIQRDDLPADELVARMEFPDLGGVTVAEAGENLRRNLAMILDTPPAPVRPCWACGDPVGFHVEHRPCWDVPPVKPFRFGDHVEWNPTADTWEVASVLAVVSDNAKIRLHENDQVLTVNVKNLRRVGLP